MGVKVEYLNPLGQKKKLELVTVARLSFVGAGVRAVHESIGKLLQGTVVVNLARSWVFGQFF